LIVEQEAIEQAEQRGLVRVSGDEVFVGHPMYGEVRLARTGSTRLRRLRGQIASAMKDDGSAAAVMKRGLLWLDSDLPSDPELLLSAATAASSLLDFETARRLFTAASNTDIGAQARVPLAFSLFMMEKGEFSLNVLDTVEPNEEAQAVFINDVVMRAANLLWGMRSPERSWRFIDEVLETADGAARLQLLVFRANQLALAARPLEVLEIMHSVDCDTLDSYGATMGHSVQSMAYGELGQPDRAVAKALDAGRTLARTEQRAFLCHPLTEFHTFALAAAGRLGEAVDVAERHSLSQRDEPLPAQMMASEILGMAELAAGDLAGALRHLPDGISADMANSFHVANSFHRFHLLRSQALARTGNADGAARALNLARAHRHPAYEYVRSTELLSEAWLAAIGLRPGEARRLARSAADFARSHDQLAREVWCLQTAAHFDDTGVSERLRELAMVVGGPRVAVAARYAAALRADDATGLDQASADFENMGDLLASADAAGQAATAHRRSGKAGSAMTAAARSHQLAARCGGATSPAIQGADFAPPFTNREREIAILVADGLTNRQIAESVSLSVRTIESHIYRASNKAGVTGRSKLGDLMRGTLAISIRLPDSPFS
jgi:hypothetical protein